MKKKAAITLAVSLVAIGAVGAATVSDFVDACLSWSNLERPICECAGKKAKERLSPKGFEFLVASLKEDEKKTDKLRAELPFTEAIAAGMFMVNGPAECARELAPQ